MNTRFTRIYILSLLFILTSFAAYAHTGSIKGGVYDSSSLKPIEGADVYIPELNNSSVTDIFGTYFFKNLPQGTYTVIINHIGYDNATEKLTVNEGETITVSTRISPSQVRMSEVMINAKRDQNFNAISAIDIKLRPVNTSQDMLKMVPGLFIAQHAGGGKAEQMFLRGFDIDHGTDINIQVDGMPVNMVSHAHGQGYADLHFVIPELVEKMNFGKGPYRADKGNLATAGYVDFKTSDYIDNSFVKAEGGNFGYFRTVGAIDLMGRSDVNNINGAYIAGEYSNSRGYFDAPQNFNRLNLFGKTTHVLSKNRLVSVSASAFRSNWDASGQIPERAVAEGLIGRFGELQKGEGGNTSRYNLNLQYNQSIGDHQSFNSNMYLSYYDFELYSDFTFFLNDSMNGDQIRQKEKRVLTGYNATYNNSYTLAGMRALTEIGAGFRYDNSMDNELSHTKDRTKTITTLSLGNINETNVYGYASQTIFLTPQLSLNGILRYDELVQDYYNKLDTTRYNRQAYYTGVLSPKANIYYNFADNARIFFNYGIGFHSNDTRVVVAQKGVNILPRAFSYDLGTIIKPLKPVLLSASVWMLDMEDEFVYVGDEAVVENGGRTRRMGVDFSARYEVLKWLYLDGDFNYTHARLRDEPTGMDYVPLAAGTTSIGGITFKHKGFASSIRFRHIGNRPANEDYSVTAKGYTLCDATVNYSQAQYEFGLQLQNIFNSTWNEAQFDTETRLRNEAAPVSELHFTPGTPFFVKLSATYKF
jgi:outer membrane cobalamin receptor